LTRPDCAATAAIILAAGESTRMGTSKALLPWGNSSLIQHVVKCHEAAGCTPLIIVVGGTHEEAVRQEAASLDGVLVVQNPNPSLGMLSSIQRGLAAAMEAGAEVITFCPVDVPLEGPQTVEATLAGFFGNNAECAVAGFEGRTGHPVVISTRVAQALLVAEKGSNPRETLAGFSRVIVETTDPAACENLNTPEDVHRWNKRVEPD